jgi:hypothetical protein
LSVVNSTTNSIEVEALHLASPQRHCKFSKSKEFHCAETTMRIPNPDPGELWTDINTQLFGSPDTPGPGQQPTMGGFASNQGRRRKQQNTASPTCGDATRTN